MRPKKAVDMARTLRSAARRFDARSGLIHCPAAGYSGAAPGSRKWWPCRKPHETSSRFADSCSTSSNVDRFCAARSCSLPGEQAIIFWISNRRWLFRASELLGATEPNSAAW